MVYIIIILYSDVLKSITQGSSLHSLAKITYLLFPPLPFPVRFTLEHVPSVSELARQAGEIACAGALACPGELLTCSLMFFYGEEEER